MENTTLSLLYPTGQEKFKNLSDVSFHDLGIDFICEKVSDKYEEQQIFAQFFTKMSDDPEITDYRCQIFDDIYNHPEMSQKLYELLQHIDYEKQFSGFFGHYEETNSAWELLHRLEEINDYIKTVEAMYECLSDVELKSAGMNHLKNYINNIYNENGFVELKKDIKEVKLSTSNLKSVTLGINLNEKYEAHGIGLISLNKKEFTKSSVLSGFYSKLAEKDSIKEEATWKNDFKYHEISSSKQEIERIISLATINDTQVANSTYYMDKIANQMIGGIVHKLKALLKKYVYVPVTDITNLIPEFIFYIRFAEYIKSMEDKGFKFCMAKIAAADKPKSYMQAKGIYNFKLLSNFAEDLGPAGIVQNDLDFNPEHTVYILTGANRGGKTTITQAIGLLFVLAQAGLYVPGDSFEFNPVDSIFTHYPADEDKTMDLGRLGEECKRFKDLFNNCTQTSLLLMNETYSTTSFEEGFYIAKDSVKALLTKGVRTIYNTHMHKLAFDINEINEISNTNKAASLVVKSSDGHRSFKVEVAPPEGQSFASDIAEKYGVTYKMLLDDSN
ncbi:MAG: hypothetical protein MJ162_08445 [Treponema sp.]|nr:hypothetical protein [Treponema sp.]